MILITTLILAPLTLILLILAFYALTTASSFFNRIIITMLLIVGLGISFISFNHLLSLPKPVSMEWLYKNIKTVVIIGAKIDNEKAIYLWLDIPDTEEPRYYIFNWSEKLARQLKKALDKQAGSQTTGQIIMKNPFSNRDSSFERTESDIQFVPIDTQLPEKSYEQ